MNTTWLTTMKPSFQTEWLALPPKEAHQVLEKIKLLSEDPTPDAKVKKQIKKYKDVHFYRIRSGDYRIFYTFEHPYISLLGLRRRNEDTDDEDHDVEFLGGLDADLNKTTMTRTTQLSSLVKSYPSIFSKVSQSRAGQDVSILKLSSGRQREREG